VKLELGSRICLHVNYGLEGSLCYRLHASTRLHIHWQRMPASTLNFDRVDFREYFNAHLHQLMWQYISRGSNEAQSR
jgi:hypothetical protein